MATVRMDGRQAQTESSQPDYRVDLSYCEYPWIIGDAVQQTAKKRRPLSH